MPGGSRTDAPSVLRRLGVIARRADMPRSRLAIDRCSRRKLRKHASRLLGTRYANHPSHRGERRRRARPARDTTIRQTSSSAAYLAFHPRRKAVLTPAFVAGPAGDHPRLPAVFFGGRSSTTTATRYCYPARQRAANGEPCEHLVARCTGGVGLRGEQLPRRSRPRTVDRRRRRKSRRRPRCSMRWAGARGAPIEACLRSSATLPGTAVSRYNEATHGADPDRR